LGARHPGRARDRHANARPSIQSATMIAASIAITLT
jgi:hypothetical protein